MSISKMIEDIKDKHIRGRAMKAAERDIEVVIQLVRALEAKNIESDDKLTHSQTLVSKVAKKLEEMHKTHVRADGKESTVLNVGTCTDINASIIKDDLFGVK